MLKYRVFCIFSFIGFPIFIILVGMYIIESSLMWKMKEALVTQEYRLKVIKKGGQMTAECNYWRRK